MKLSGKLDAFVPKHFNGKKSLHFMNVLAVLTSVPKRVANEHLQMNKSNWEAVSKVAMKDGYIEYQPKMKGLSFGKNTKLFNKMFNNGQLIDASFNCCEIIAIYNAFKDLKLNPDMPKLLYDFERKGTVLLGYFGSSFLRINAYLKEKGLEIASLYGKAITREALSKWESEYDVYIYMTYNNAEKITGMIHTMSVTHSDKGYMVHNTYEAHEYYDNLYDAIFSYNKSKGHASKPIGITGVRRKV